MTSKPTAARYAILAAASFLFAAAGAHAQASAPAAQVQDVTVVTLYSQTSRAPVNGLAKKDEGRPPIQIVDGGVKSAGPSCWKLSDTGEISPTEGECYILRSAGPGEVPPAR